MSYRTSRIQSTPGAYGHPKSRTGGEVSEMRDVKLVLGWLASIAAGLTLGFVIGAVAWVVV